MLDGIVNDGGHTFGEFNRDYSDAPVIADVDVAGKNLASPYVPNPSSPGPGSMNPADIPAPPADFGQVPNDQCHNAKAAQAAILHNRQALVAG